MSFAAPPPVHLAVSGVVFDCHNFGGAAGIWCVGARDAAKDPNNAQDIPATKNNLSKMILRNPVLKFESNPSPHPPHFSIRATQELKDLISKRRQFSFGSHGMAKFAPYLSHPFRSRFHLNDGASDIIWICCEQPAIKTIASQLIQKSQIHGCFSSDCGLLRPPPTLIQLPRRKQLLSDRGLPPLL